MKKHTKAQNEAIKKAQAESKISRLEVSKRVKARVVVSTTDTNRETRRMQQKMSGRLSNTGRPSAGIELRENERHNKKLAKSLKKAVDNKLAYTKSQMKECKKILKDPSKHSDFDVLQATKLTTRLGQYSNAMICVDDLVAQVRKVG